MHIYVPSITDHIQCCMGFMLYLMTFKQKNLLCTCYIVAFIALIGKSPLSLSSMREAGRHQLLSDQDCCCCSLLK